MSKKKRSPQHQPKKQSPKVLSIPELQQAAEEALNKTRYKDAIDYYKQLLKQAETDKQADAQATWKKNLAQAYLARGRELAAKEMFKEAAVMWENRASICADESEVELYIGWLLKVGNYARAAEIYQQKQTELTATAKQLPALFGAALLGSDHAVLRQTLSKMEGWASHIQAAETLLKGYCKGIKGEELEELLKAISFRSPFRDFRTVIKALVTLETDPSAALQMAQKIPSDSPYKGLAQLLPNPALEFLDSAQSLTKPRHGQDAFLGSIYGWGKKQLLAFQALMSFKNDNQKALFELVLKHNQGLGKDYVQQLCKQWIPHLPPSSIKAYERYFPFEGLEYDRVYSLALENEGLLDEALESWEDALAVLSPKLSEAKARAQTVLIQRRCIALLRKMDEDFLSTLEEPLQQCIELKPEDKTSWLELIALYKAEGNKTTYYDWVNKALEQFPKDVDVLLVGVEAAQQRKAFKKAASYAQTILQVDPINVKARQTLIDSHISHARKQFKQDKLHLVSKELTAATQYERGEAHIALRINQALLAYQQDNSAAARRFLEEAMKQAGSVLGAYAIIFIESQQAKLNPTVLAQVYKKKSKSAPLLPAWGKSYVPTAAELMRLPTLLSPYKKMKELKTFFKEWQALLKKAAEQTLSREQLLTLCDFFMTTELYELLKIYAKAGLQQQGEQPIFVFYEIYGKAEGTFYQVTTRDHDRLEEALDEAKAASDDRTVVLIVNFFKQGRGLFSFRPPRDMPIPFGMPMDIPDEVKEKVEALLVGDKEEVVRELFDGKIPSEEELEELGPEGLIRLLLEKGGMKFDDENEDEQDRGGKL